MLHALLWNLVLTSVLAVALAIVCRLPPLRRRPALRHTLWLLLLAKLLTPPLISLPLLPARASGEATVGIETTFPEPLAHADTAPIDLAPNTERADSAAERPISTRRSGETLPLGNLLLVISLAGSMAMLVLYGIRIATLRRWLTRAGAANDLLAQRCPEIAARLGIRRPIRSCAVDARVPPLLWGLCRPMVVMPQSLIDDLQPEQLRGIVAHELGHYLRRDHWANLFAVLVKALMWWNPVAWWAHRELRAAQEHCCDAIAVDVCNRRCYATTLLQALEFVQSGSFTHRELALCMGVKGSVLRRFEMIADSRLSHRSPRYFLPILVILAAPLLCMPVRTQLAEAAGSGAPDVTDDASQKELQVGDNPESVFLAGIVWRKSSASGKQEPTVWVRDRATTKTTHLRDDSVFRVERVSAAIEEINKNFVLLSVNGKRRQWKLGDSFAALLKQKAAVSEVSANDKSKDGDERIEVRIELLGDQMVIRGKKDHVKRVTELLRRLEQADEKTNRRRQDQQKENKPPQPSELRAHSLRDLDSQTVLAVARTLLAGRPAVRMTVDPASGHLIVLAPAKAQTAVQQMLRNMRSPVGAAANKPPKPMRQSDEGTFRLSFRHQPWADVLKWYAQQAGLSLVLSDSIPGTFSYSARKAYTATQCLDILNSVLSVKGFVLVRRDRMLIVVNLENGIPGELVTRCKIEDLDRRGKYEFVRVMFPLGRRDAEKARAEVSPLLSKAGRVVVLPQTRQLMVTDRNHIVRLIGSIIESIPEPKAGY